MKDYINLFYAMLDKFYDWDSLSLEGKKAILLTFLDNNVNTDDLIEYIEKYRQNLLNNTLNFYLKGVVKT